MFDDRLKKLRKTKNFSMKQMAEALGMCYTTYVNYEKNEREPNSEGLVLIARYFGVTVDYLLGINSTETTVDNYLQKEVDTLAAVEEVYGKNIKDLVCIASELNEQGVDKLHEHCCDLLEISKYRK